MAKHAVRNIMCRIPLSLTSRFNNTNGGRNDIESKTKKR